MGSCAARIRCNRGTGCLLRVPLRNKGAAGRLSPRSVAPPCHPCRDRVPRVCGTRLRQRRGGHDRHRRRVECRAVDGGPVRAHQPEISRRVPHDRARPGGRGRAHRLHPPAHALAVERGRGACRCFVDAANAGRVAPDDTIEFVGDWPRGEKLTFKPHNPHNVYLLSWSAADPLQYHTEKLTAQPATLRGAAFDQTVLLEVDLVHRYSPCHRT